MTIVSCCQISISKMKTCVHPNSVSWKKKPSTEQINKLEKAQYLREIGIEAICYEHSLKKTHTRPCTDMNAIFQCSSISSIFIFAWCYWFFFFVRYIFLLFDRTTVSNEIRIKLFSIALPLPLSFPESVLLSLLLW